MTNLLFPILGLFVCIVGTQWRQQRTPWGFVGVGACFLATFANRLAEQRLGHVTGIEPLIMGVMAVVLAGQMWKGMRG